MTFTLDEADEIVRFNVRYKHANGQEADVVVGTPICFEDTVPGVCREMVWGSGSSKQAQLLINLSNDGWFGRSIAGREMHLLISRFRSIENRVPLLRSVNTGISASIDASGRVITSLSANTKGRIEASVQLDRGWSVFGAIGQLPSAIMSIVLLVGIVLSLWYRSVETPIEVSE